MKRKSNLALVLALMLSFGFYQQMFGQAFTEVPQTFAATYYGAAVWADYDRDGNLDFFVNGWRSTGGSTSAPSAYLYRNNGNGSFSEVATGILPLGACSAAWGDLNNDGYPDLCIAGNSGNSIYATKVYKNNGNGSFTDIGGSFTPVITPAIVWSDLNNDGFQDLTIMGGDNTSAGQTTIYLNNQNETFTEIASSLMPMTNGAVAAGDLNNDGLNDLVIAGRFTASDYHAKIYLNQGDAVFTELPAGLVPARYSAISLYDYSGDGYLDILIAGGDNNDVLRTTLYKNINGTAFSVVPTTMTGVIQGSVAWGDVNNDGLSDVLLTGSDVPTGATRVTKIYLNQGNDLFAPLNYTFEGLRRSMAQWGDYNNDGKLDVLVTGYRNVSDYITKVFTNNTTLANTEPTTPAGLASTVTGGSAQLSWDASQDSQTTSSSLTYAVRIGSSPGSQDILSPGSDAATGKLSLPRNGNANTNTLLNIQGLDYGTYYWSVQAVDGAYQGSAEAQEHVFVVSDLLTATFQVTSGGQALAGATVSIGSQQIQTNEQGIAIFNLGPGNYTYTITHPFHAPANGVFAITDASVSITVEMQALPAYNLTFAVTGPSGPVANAQIDIAGQNLLTDVNGNATIFILAGTHTYYIYAEGYNQIRDEVTVSGTMTLPVNAIPVEIQQLPYSEYFTAPVQPLHWLTFDETNTGYSWFFEDERAIIDSDIAGQGVNVKASLISPPFALSGPSSSINLQFSHFFNHFGTNNTATVFYQTDNETWQTLVVFNQVEGTIDNFAEEEFILTGFGNDATTIRFKFTYDDGNHWAEQWMIDEVHVSEAIAYQMTISNLLKPTYAQTPLSHFEPFTFGARGQNTGALALENVYLNVFYENWDAANSIMVPFFPVGGQYDFTASPPFMPELAGNYVFFHHFMAPLINLSGPTNLAALQIIVSDSVFATDYEESPASVQITAAAPAGNMYQLITGDYLQSFTVGWKENSLASSFTANVYHVNPGTLQTTLVASTGNFTAPATTDLQFVTYSLSSPLALEAGYYALILTPATGVSLGIGADGVSSGRYWTHNANNLTLVEQPATGNIKVRINVKDTGVGIHESATEKVRLYPNPLQQEGIVVNETGRELAAQIIDLTGKTLRNLQLQTGKNSFSANGLSPGIYLLKTEVFHLVFMVSDQK